MPAHEEFLQLGALAAIGQVTASEQEDLSAHFRECPECREAYADYSRILRQDLPHANPGRFRGKQRSLHPANDCELRDRFLARAKAQGVNFSPEVEKRATVVDKSVLPRWPWQFAFVPVVATFVVAAGLTWIHVLSPRIRIQRAAPDFATLAKNESLQQKLDRDTQALDVLNNDLSVLSKDNSNLARSLKEKDTGLRTSKRNLDQLTTDLSQARTQNAILLSAHEYDEAVASDLRKQIQALEEFKTNSVASLVELQEKIHSLKATVEQQSEKLAMERQMASVSSDVRQLMGARQLHIIDVQDVNGTGKSAKSFGRVFYAEGQALVFFAFDLPNGKLTPAKYRFQAWGQQEGDEQSIRDLGVFSIDDREQHRWVLRVTDASLLKGMDCVFVTAENAGGADKPRGKRVLYAYLAGGANHP